MNNWGVPDWRDGAAYKTNLSKTQWRWEFLRRRNDYREDWLLHFERSFRRSVARFRNIPVRPGFGSWEKFFSTSADMPGCLEKYGMPDLLDPSSKVSSFGLFGVSAPHGVSHAHAREETFDPYENGKLLMAFDLHRPLPEQLREAKGLLELYQAELYGKPEGGRDHVSKWATYLRVLDARDAGETFEAIGMALLVESDEVGGSEAAAKAHQVWKAAQKLMFNWRA